MSRRLSLDDLPPAYRAQAERQLAAATNAPPAPVVPGAPSDAPPTPPQQRPRRPRNTARSREPNKTEALFNRSVLRGRGLYEAVTFHTPSGAYTPDYCVWDEIGRLSCYEVKGSYRLGSQQAARRAFLDARDRFPSVAFRWFKRTSIGGFEEWYAEDGT